MHLADKEIIVIIGPSRVGKGTLIEALKGKKMKYWKVEPNFDDEADDFDPNKYGEATNKMCPVKNE